MDNTAWNSKTTNCLHFVNKAGGKLYEAMQKYANHETMDLDLLQLFETKAIKLKQFFHSQEDNCRELRAKMRTLIVANSGRLGSALATTLSAYHRGKQERLDALKYAYEAYEKLIP